MFHFCSKVVSYLSNDGTDLNPSHICYNHQCWCKADVNNYIDFNEYVPEYTLGRTSPDTQCNAVGYRLLELCKSTGFPIVNGRIADLYGKCMFISRQGSTNIDYLLVKECNFSHINNFNVHGVTIVIFHSF